MVKKVLICALACLSLPCHVCSATKEIKNESTEVVIEQTIADAVVEVDVENDVDKDEDTCNNAIDNDVVEDEVLLHNSLLDESQEDESLFDAIEDTEHDHEFQERFHRLKMYWAVMIFKVRNFFKQTVPSWFTRKQKLEDNNN